MLSLFIFHRDLRLQDNTALLAALEQSSQVIPCFIFDPVQIENNAYKSAASLQFMIESLRDLHQQLAQRGGKLFIFYGNPCDVIGKIIKLKNIKAVYFNHDYTPFSQKRDKAIIQLCQQHHIKVHTYDDILLQAPGLHLKQDATPYLQFTAFYQHARTLLVPTPIKNNATHYYNGDINFSEDFAIFDRIVPKTNPKLAVHGGRMTCIQQLEKLRSLKNYVNHRDFPNENATTHLSAHLKFGTCSVREIFHAIQKRVAQPQELLRQLYWRDFFTSILYYFPHVLGHAFQKKYDHIKWQNNKMSFNAWCQGETGFPLVDAGMRELNQTGYMHNRVRLVTASFLVKDLHIDWRWGEKYFAQQLVDYDPAVNNGNWQWVASTGVDHQPYFRIFNPWLQQKKFDLECHYIKAWVPELHALSPKIIHDWYKPAHHTLANYPQPMLDHKLAAAQAKALFKA